MINPLIHYELEMTIRQQAQLQRQVSLWRLAKQAARAAKHSAEGSPLRWIRHAVIRQQARVQTAHVPEARRGLSTQ
jgi:hypothetical protein